MEDKKRERKEVKEETRLVELCEGHHSGLTKCFTLPDGQSMVVKHLKGYTEETLKKHVKEEGGPHGLIPGWLKEKDLRRYLRGYLSPTLTKKASEEAPALCSLIIKDYNDRKGLYALVECQHGADFLPQAKAAVRAKFNVQQEDEIFFCCYATGSSTHIAFQEAQLYWSLKPESVIFFWTGARPESSEKKQQEMAAGLADLQRVVRRLQATRSSVKDQNERWDQAGMLRVEEMENCFPDSVNVEQSLLDEKRRKERAPKENDVQELWNDVLGVPELDAQSQVIAAPRVFPVHGTCVFKECRKPNGIQFSCRLHEVDIVLLVRAVRAMEYLDTPIELKQRIDADAWRREVVLEIVDRIAFIFDAQPMRSVCWGVGMDGSNVLFVRSDRALNYVVTPTLSLWGKDGVSRLLFRFLGASPASRGFIPVTPQIFWGLEGTLLSPGGDDAVFALSDDLVAKVGPQVAIHRELSVLLGLGDACGLVAPAIEPCVVATGNNTWPCGFQMRRHSLVEISNEHDLARLWGEIFWRLGVLHECGVVHNDVKPANLLSTMDGSHLLCDFGNALQWTMGNPVPALKGATRFWNVVPLLFHGTDQDMRKCDMEGLFWTIVTMWLQFVDRKRSVPQLSGKERCAVVAQLGRFGGVWRGHDHQLELIKPKSPLLVTCFQQAQTEQQLISPSNLFDAYASLRLPSDSKDTWLTKVEAMQGQHGEPPCPRQILSWLFTRRSLELHRVSE